MHNDDCNQIGNFICITEAILLRSMSGLGFRGMCAQGVHHFRAISLK